MNVFEFINGPYDDDRVIPPIDLDDMRRCRDDPEGRDFNCQYCDKCYLSYPALYGHMKIKHPEMMTFDPRRQKKRGRPPLTDTENRNKLYQPVDPISYLYETIKDVYKMQKVDKDPIESNLYLCAKKYSFHETPGNPNKGVEDIALYSYHRMSYKEKCKMNIDEIMALYLRDLSRKAKLKSYKMILKFMVLFHECLNEMGWQQKVYSDSISFFSDFEKGFSHDYLHRNQTELKINQDIQEYKDSCGGLEYCQANNGEHIPLIVNRFIMEYCQKEDYGIDFKHLVEFTQNFCKWLVDQEHTLLQITLLRD